MQLQGQKNVRLTYGSARAPVSIYIPALVPSFNPLEETTHRLRAPGSRHLDQTLIVTEGRFMLPQALAQDRAPVRLRNLASVRNRVP